MFSAIGVVLFASVLLPTNGPSDTTITITASIEPARTIVVDDSLVIRKVISNTSRDVDPKVVVGSDSGSQIAYSSDIKEQYVRILNRYEISEPGVFNVTGRNFIEQLIYNLRKNFRNLVVPLDIV